MAETVHTFRGTAVWRRRTGALLLALLAPAAGAAEVAARWSAGAGLGYDSNPASAEAGSALPATGFASASLAADFTVRPTPNTALLLRGGVDGQQYFEDAGLSNGKAPLLLRALYRPGGGFFAPTLAAWGSAAAWQFRSRMRSGAEFRGGAYAAEQLSTAIGLRAGGYLAERRSASRVFDGRAAAATLDLDWLLGDALTAYLGYEFRYGDFAVSSPPDPVAAQFALAKAADDALRRDGAAETAYRIRGHAHIGTLGLNYALSPRLAVDAQGRQVHSRADFGDHYNRWLSELSLLYRF